jgi:hypothetical protein
MRNPFARLAKRDAVRPSLRERAAILKASASRVIRRKPAGSAVEYADSQEVPISQDPDAITGLIARSPLLDQAAVTADAELLALGREFDALHAEWLLACIASQAAEEKAAVISSDLERRKGWTAREINEASLAQPGVTEAMEAGYAMNVRIEKVMTSIRALPAQTLDGLAVKARTAIPGIWTSGQYQEDAGLGDDEDWTELNARSLIDECLSLAGVDWMGRRRGAAPNNADRVAPTSLADVSDTASKVALEAMDLTDVPLDALFAMADLYATGARHFEVGAFWPKLSGGAKRPGQALIIAEGDRLSLSFHAVVDEISRRDPGSNDTLIDQRGEWLMRAAVHDGGWEAMTKIVSETRVALGIEG